MLGIYVWEALSHKRAFSKIATQLNLLLQYPEKATLVGGIGTFYKNLFLSKVIDVASSVFNVFFWLTDQEISNCDVLMFLQPMHDSIYSFCNTVIRY